MSFADSQAAALAAAELKFQPRIDAGVTVANADAWADLAYVIASGATATGVSAAASMYLTGGAASTTIPFVDTPVKAVGTTTAGSYLGLFTHSGSNRLTFTGPDASVFRVDVSCKLLGGAGEELAVVVAVNGSALPESARGAASDTTSGVVGSITTFLVCTLDTDDYIEVFVENRTDTTAITLVELVACVGKVG